MREENKYPQHLNEEEIIENEDSFTDEVEVNESSLDFENNEDNDFEFAEIINSTNVGIDVDTVEDSEDSEEQTNTEENLEDAIVDEVEDLLEVSDGLDSLVGDFEDSSFDFNEEGIDVDSINLTGEFCDSNGNPIEKLKTGRMVIDTVNLDDIHIPPRGKVLNLDYSDLEESIHSWGLVEPLHVIPYKNEIQETKFILVHGYRRYLACKGLGMSTVPCVVDTTRPKEVVRYLEVISNNVRPYNFPEIMLIGRYIEERQKGFSHETIENILGLSSGTYLKAKYVDSTKSQFFEIYDKVVKNKMTIDAAFRKIEKEIQKAEEGDSSALDNLNQNGLDTGYDQFNEDIHTQQKGERHPLDPGLRKAVERRDDYTCQSCGLGKENPLISAIFHAHHMIPVKHKGSDIEENLIMLCPNCHSLVHSIEEKKFRPKAEMLENDEVLTNVVILANVIMKGIPDIYGGNAYTFYMERAKRSFIE